MRAIDQKRILAAKRKTCACGATAVKFSTGDWACQRCIDWEATFWATPRIRSTCGVGQDVNYFRVLR